MRPSCKSASMLKLLRHFRISRKASSVSPSSFRFQALFMSCVKNYEYAKRIRNICLEGRLDEAIREIRCRGVVLSKDIIFYMLQGGLKRKDLKDCRKIHLLMLGNGLYAHTILADNLIHLFATCGSLSEAIQVFRVVAEPSVFTWNMIISAHMRFSEHEKAIELFFEMQKQGEKADSVTFSCILKACGHLLSLKHGQVVHDLIVRTGCQSNLIMDSTLVDMYAKCKSVKEARHVFSGMETRDVVAWATMIAAYAEEDGTTALELFEEMQHENLKPNIVVISSVLKACGNIQDIDRGRLVHDQVNRTSLRSDVVIGSTLVDMYVKCRSILEARKIFDDLEMQDVVTWGTMINGYTMHGDFLVAFELFETMKLCGVMPNKIIFECLLKTCNTLEYIRYGRLIHCQVTALRLELDLLVSSTLVYTYIKIGLLNEGHKLYYESPSHDVFSWDYLLNKDVECGGFTSALAIYDKIESTVMSKSIIMNVLKICHSLGRCLTQSLLIHHCTILNGFELDEAIGSSLIALYAKSGSIESAKKVFEMMPTVDLVLWGAIIAGHVYHGDGYSALKLFEVMQKQQIPPTEYIFSCILKACARTDAFEQGKWVHDMVIRSASELNAVVSSSIVDMYAKCGHLQDAERVFVKLSTRDSTSWGALIAGYSAYGDFLKVFECFEQMQEDGIVPDKVIFSSMLNACGTARTTSAGMQLLDKIVRVGVKVDVVLGNSILDMYSKCGRLEDAQKVFDEFHNKDLVSWGIMLSGYALNGQSAHAINLFDKMLQMGIQPNSVMYLSILKACGSVGTGKLIRSIHDLLIKEQIELEQPIGNALITVYAKCGSFLEARKVLDNLPNPDTTSWVSMVAGLSGAGDCNLVRQYLKDMQDYGLEPRGTCSINMLSACRHAGILNESLELFDSVTGNNGSSLTLQLYGCMTDFLGRVGYLEEAEDMVQTMPSSPDMISWTSFLTSCKRYGETTSLVVCMLFNKSSYNFSHLISQCISREPWMQMCKLSKPTRILTGDLMTTVGSSKSKQGSSQGHWLGTQSSSMPDLLQASFTESLQNLPVHVDLLEVDEHLKVWRKPIQVFGLPNQSYCCNFVRK